MSRLAQTESGLLVPAHALPEKKGPPRYERRDHERQRLGLLVRAAHAGMKKAVRKTTKKSLRRAIKRARQNGTLYG